MRRRAEMLGGGVEFVSAPGLGCRVTIRIPLRQSTLARQRYSIG